MNAGGISLIFAIQTRLAALFSVPVLLGATFFHLDNGWLFSADGGGWEFPASLTIIAIAVALMGPGLLHPFPNQDWSMVRGWPAH